MQKLDKQMLYNILRYLMTIFDNISPNIWQYLTVLTTIFANICQNICGHTAPTCRSQALAETRQHRQQVDQLFSKLYQAASCSTVHQTLLSSCASNFTKQLFIKLYQSASCSAVHQTDCCAVSQHCCCCCSDCNHRIGEGAVLCHGSLHWLRTDI